MKMIQKMVMGYFIGVMVEYIKDIGKMVNNMVKVNM